MTEPITTSALGLDLSPRLVASTTVVASPAANAETIVASVTVPDNTTIVRGVLLVANAALTVGTNGVSVTLAIRQTSVSGSVVATTGATTAVAATLIGTSVVGLDTAPAAGRIYKATVTVGSGSAASTVSAVTLAAIAV